MSLFRARTSHLLLVTALLALTPLSPMGAARAQSSEAAPSEDPDLGVVLDAEEMRAFHSGQDLTGCYYGQPEDVTWSERMAADGRLYDLEQAGALVGRWWINGELEGAGVICFLYTDRPPGPYCFTGRRRGAWMDFYTAFGGGIVATTQCGDDPIA